MVDRFRLPLARLLVAAAERVMPEDVSLRNLMLGERLTRCAVAFAPRSEPRERLYCVMCGEPGEAAGLLLVRFSATCIKRNSPTILHPARVDASPAYPPGTR